MFRYLFTLCLVAAIAVAVSAEVDQTVNDVSEVESRTAQGSAVAKIIGKVAAGIAKSCILEAAENCAQHWKNPSAAITCAKEFFKANKGWCAAHGV